MLYFLSFFSLFLSPALSLSFLTATRTTNDTGNHGIIASKRCDHLLVEDNVSYDNEGSGIMLHKSCDDSIVRGNVAYSNFDAGLSLVETSRCSVTNNEFEDNRWGTRVILGSTDNVVSVLSAARVICLWCV